MVSGAWSGWWEQDGARSPMAATLALDGGSLSGEGRDRAGLFFLEGRFGGGRAVFTKRYAGHHFRYEGAWDGAALAGTWTYAGEPRESGAFRLAPDGSEGDGQGDGGEG